MTDLARLRSVLRGAGRSRTVPIVLPPARVFEPEAFAAALGGALLGSLLGLRLLHQDTVVDLDAAPHQVRW